MLVFMIIVIVLIGVAYADYCLIDNTAHFGICFGKVAEAEEARDVGILADAEVTVAPAVAEPPAEARDAPFRPPRNPAPAWLLLDLEPVLELHEGWTRASS